MVNKVTLKDGPSVTTIEANRKLWNAGQAELRRTLLSFKTHEQAVELFLHQHAMLHSVQVDQTAVWSYEDDILDDLDEARFRRIPADGEHSIAWVIWHLARIEDVTMNLLAAGTPQTLHKDGWYKRLKISHRDTGNLMGVAGIAAISAGIDLQTLRAYRLAVGRRTRAIVRQLLPEDLKRKVDPIRLQQVLTEGALAPDATDVLAYWGGLTIAGLLLMPPTRHNFIHLNEALRLKQKR